MDAFLCDMHCILSIPRHFDLSLTNSELALPTSARAAQSSGSGGASSEQIVEKSLTIIVNKEVQLGVVYKDF